MLHSSDMHGRFDTRKEAIMKRPRRGKYFKIPSTENLIPPPQFPTPAQTVSDSGRKFGKNRKLVSPPLDVTKQTFLSPDTNISDTNITTGLIIIYRNIMSNTKYLRSGEQDTLNKHTAAIDEKLRQRGSQKPERSDTKIDWFQSLKRSFPDQISSNDHYKKEDTIKSIEETWDKIQRRKREVYDTFATVDQYIETSHTLAQSTLDGSQELQAQYQQALDSKKALREQIENAQDYKIVSQAVKDYSRLMINQTDDRLIQEVSENTPYLTQDQRMKLLDYQRAIAISESADSPAPPTIPAESALPPAESRLRRQRPEDDNTDIGISTAREPSREVAQRHETYPEKTPSQDTALGPKETAIIELKKLWLDIQDRQEEKARLLKTGEQRLEASHQWVQKTFRERPDIQAKFPDYESNYKDILEAAGKHRASIEHAQTYEQFLEAKDRYTDLIAYVEQRETEIFYQTVDLSEKWVQDINQAQKKFQELQNSTNNKLERLEAIIRDERSIGDEDFNRRLRESHKKVCQDLWPRSSQSIRFDLRAKGENMDGITQVTQELEAMDEELGQLLQKYP